ncbi:MAG: glycosyltransferase [Rhodobiaceae bacterium]|nr:glycosyltransferase [Rhodobiaceae bacterium]MCC0053083.1 glycosyltransferase [Rhodobiaceae bacterium]
MPPAASIVIPAYNRADVMRFAIKSVLQQDMPDWELIVVGDGCSDQSEAVVASFDDPRISWENMAVNSGGQSAPINRGMQKAKGEYLFILGQDDFYFADRLSHSIAVMQSSGADMLWAPVVLLHAAGERTGPPDHRRDCVRLDGVTTDGSFQAEMFMSGSSWTVRRSTWERVGEWVHADEAFVSPSQDWIFRAWRKGVDLRFDPHPCVLAIHAGVRKLTYRRSLHAEHERAWEWIKDKPSVSRDILESVAIQHAKELGRRSDIDALCRQSAEALEKIVVAQSANLGRGGLIRAWTKSRWVPLITRAARLLSRLGIHPLGLQRRIAGERKGHFVREHRRFTHDVPQVEGDDLPIGSAAGDDFVGFGWHECENGTRWTHASAAEIIFGCSAPGACEALEIDLAPLRASEPLRILVNGAVALEKTIEGRESIHVPIPATVGGQVNLVIESSVTTTPKDLGIGDDDRFLGLCFHSMKLVRRAGQAP